MTRFTYQKNSVRSTQRFQLQANDTLFVMVGATLGEGRLCARKGLTSSSEPEHVVSPREAGHCRCLFSVHYAFRHAVKAVSVGSQAGVCSPR